jgi:hypothetical protein
MSAYVNHKVFLYFLKLFFTVYFVQDRCNKTFLFVVYALMR